ncbi:MAG: translocation/assembly module TamB domain-containing protein [Oligoflexia bacterium]|nr:translocation/assembly module TamB domain-containing protein [Oligoflexia bacterium]
MRRNGVKLLVLGLLLGIAAGLGVRWVQRYIARELVSMLDDEAIHGAGCRFRVGSIRISLLALNALAKDAALECDGERKLAFESLKADFSLARLREHKILLSHLDMHNGFAKGVGPQSATYRFIDWLAAPLPPEKDYPGRWKIKLMSLKMDDTWFSEQNAAGEIKGRGAELYVERTAENDFVLKPFIRTLRMRIGSADHRSIKLGRAKSEIYLADDFVQFRDLSVALKSSSLSGFITSHRRPEEKLEGSIRLLADSLSFDLPPDLKFHSEGAVELGGTGSAPVLEAQINQGEFSPGSFEKSGALDFKEIHSAAAIRPGNEQFLNLREFSAKSGAATLKLTEPILITGGRLSGSIKFDADGLNFDGANLGAVRSSIDLSGSFEHPEVTLSGSTERLSAGGVYSAAATFGLKLRGNDLAVQLNSLPADPQKLSVAADIDLEPVPAELKQSKIDLLVPWGASGKRGGAVLTIKGSATGPLTAEQLRGSAELKVSRPDQDAPLLAGTMQLNAAKLVAVLATSSGKLTSNLSVDFLGKKTGQLSVEARGFDPAELFPETECVSVDLSARYAFSADSPARGEGSIRVGDNALGCAPFTLRTASAYSIPIKDGVLSLPDITLRNSENGLVLGGSASLQEGLDLSARGTLSLNSLLAVAPSLDELSGELSLKLKVRGTLGTPRFEGQAELSKGRMELESGNIALDEFSGRAIFSGESIELQDLRGAFNDGQIFLSGTLFPLDLARSKIEARLTDVYMEPAPNTSVNLDAALSLKRGANGEAAIEGAITVLNGEIEREFDLTSILRAVIEMALSIRRERETIRSLPAIGLNLTISAQDELYVLTNWLGAEFSAEVLVEGQLSDPQVRGKLETLNGWLGFKDRTFDINSGTITLRPDKSEPQLDLVAESVVRSQAGDNLLVFLEARGALTNPRITLSSDSSLSQKELLALLTSGSSQPGTTRLGSQRTGLHLGEIPLLQDTPALIIGRLIKNLSTIDSLSIQPTYNEQRGVIEPTIIATKKLSDRLSLTGDSFLGSAASESTLKLTYALTPKLDVSGLISSLSTEEQLALGADAILTVLSQHRKLLDLSINGLSHFEPSEITSKLRLGEGSRLTLEDLPKLQRNIEKFLVDQGYRAARVTPECPEFDQYCRRLNINIDQGERYSIDQVITSGEELPENIRAKFKFSRFEESAATLELASGIRDELIRALRNEGFIAARVKASYEDQGQGAHSKLNLELSPGRPVSFTFQGNKIFQPTDFLETINLFNRRQPFGNNTINLLVSGIERKYREAGYLFVEIASERDEGPDGRINYLITIRENNQLKVEHVQIEAEDNLDVDWLKGQLARDFPEIYDRTFSPQFAVSEELDANAASLRTLLQEQGYPSASVSYDIQPDQEAHHVRIIYHVKPGPSDLADWIRVEGYPRDLKLPTEPHPPYSVVAASSYIDTLITALLDQGFLFPAISSSVDQNGQGLVLNVDAGQRTYISTIKIEGQQSVETEVIKQEFPIVPGQPWSDTAVDQARARLLKLGLFSRVEIAPADGELNDQQEAMLVRVTERALRTFQFGGGYNSAYGIHLFSEASDKQIFRDGRGLSLRVDGYFDPAASEVSEGIASLKYAVPGILGSDYSWIEDLRYQKQTTSTQEFDLDRLSLASYLYRAWESGYSGSLGHTILQEDLNDVSPDAIISELDSGVVRLSFLSANLAYDGRDNPLNPHRGFFASSEAHLAYKGIGSDADYYGVGGRFAYILPLPGILHRFSLANNTQAAAAYTFDGTTEVPISQRYYLGGRTTVRGFRENALGPRGEDGSIIGGDLLLMNNFEFRYLYTDTAQFHTFIDLGNVYLQDESVELGDLRRSVGLGVRYLSPIGPIGFDVGHPLDEKSGEPSVRVHFSIGTNF